MAYLTRVVPRHTSAELTKIIKKTKDEAQKTRLKVIRAAQAGAQRKEIATAFVVGERSVTSWINKYNKGGVGALKTNKGGRPKGSGVWKNDIFEKLARAIDASAQYWSIPLMQDWIKKEFNKKIPEQTVWYRMNQIGYSYKTARPHPYKGDPEKQAAFKKGGSRTLSAR